VLSNTCITRDSSSLLIYESLGAVRAVAYFRHPGQQFTGDIQVPRAVWAVESLRHP